VDGARFFNAVVALGVDPAALAGPADSVTFCLSKGLACPIGSIVVGSRAYIWRARRARKLVGGGMRQVGVLAAPGLLALSDGPDGMIARLAEDHANARRLAEGLAEMAGIESPGGVAQPTDGRLDPGRARTNFVIFRVARDRAAFLAALEARGVLVVPYAHGTIRAVTHHGITAPDIDATLAAVRASLADTARVAVGAAAPTGV
jgi:threonine aldolase